MARLAPLVLKLNDGDRSELQQLINRHNTAQQIVLRAKIILLASEGKNHGEIARTLDISLDMARLWRNRWLETSGRELSIIQRLQDMERIGAPVKFSMEQVTLAIRPCMFATLRLWTPKMNSKSEFSNLSTILIQQWLNLLNGHIKVKCWLFNTWLIYAELY